MSIFLGIGTFFYLMLGYYKFVIIFAVLLTNKKSLKMTVTYQNVVPNVTDFLVNGKIVAVIGASGGLTFLKSAKLSIKEIEAVEDKARELFRFQYYSTLNK